MKRIPAIVLLAVLSLGVMPVATAQVFMGPDSGRQAQRAAKKEQKTQNKLARKQQKAARKQAKAQRKAARKG